MKIFLCGGRVELLWYECIFSTQADKVWIFIWKPPCFHHRHLHDVCIHFFAIREQFFLWSKRKNESRENKLYNGYLWQGCCFFVAALFSFSQSSLIPPTYDSTQFYSSYYIFLLRASDAREKVANFFYFHGLMEVISIWGLERKFHEITFDGELLSGDIFYGF